MLIANVPYYGPKIDDSRRSKYGLHKMAHNSRRILLGRPLVANLELY